MGNFAINIISVLFPQESFVLLLTFGQSEVILVRNKEYAMQIYFAGISYAEII